MRAARLAGARGGREHATRGAPATLRGHANARSAARATLGCVAAPSPRRLCSRAAPSRTLSCGSPEIPDASPPASTFPTPRLEETAGISYSYGARSHFWNREGFFSVNAGARVRLEMDPPSRKWDEPARRVSVPSEDASFEVGPTTPRAAPHAPRLPSRRLNAGSSARSKAAAQRPSRLTPSRARSSDPPNAATPAK